ncbi:MAG: RHS repeat-associated core domain-containing protein [Pseudomonas sp.]
MSTTSVHSNAFGFMNFIENRVDPRTGQYGLAIALPALVGNDLAGPTLSLSLDYSSMGGGDVGYGEGWDINLTRYVEHAYAEGGGALSLFTGERFTVDGVESISEQKLDTFHFHKDGEGRFRVVHNTGLVEILEYQGAGEQRVALPTRIYAPSGQWIELSYISNPQHPGAFCLNEVRDGLPDGKQGRRLLEIAYAGDTVITLHPDAEAVKASYTLKFRGRQVHQVVLPTDEQAHWQFDYQTVHGQTCVSKVVSPSGGVEHLYYGLDGDPGHQLPGVDKMLPRVKRHRVLPGHGQAEMQTDYDYSAHNFMGNGSGIKWSNSGRDNLYDVTDASYTYWSKTTQRCEGQADRTVTTHYDRFHRTVEELSQQAKHVVKNTMDYHGDPAASFKDQPSIFQMPRTVTTSWEMAEDASQRRSEQVTTAFDIHGNLTEEIQHDGTRTVMEYFEVEGEPGRCPPSPNGFKRYVKSQTVYPSDQYESGASALRTDFTYEALDILQGPLQALDDKVATKWLAITQEVLTDAANPNPLLALSTVKRSYFSDPKNARLHGRLIKRETQMHAKHDGTEKGKQENTTTTTVEWKFAQHRHSTLGNVLHTRQMAKGHDLTEKFSEQNQHPFTGQVLETKDIHETVTRFTYDRLNRLLSETTSPDAEKPVRATRSYSYVMASADGGYQETKDSQDVVSRLYFDGLNRTIKEERECVDPDAPQSKSRKTFEVYAAVYNAFGQLTSETTYDYWADRTVAMTSVHGYDNWGGRRSILRADNVTVITERSPFGADGDIVTSWEEYPEEPDVRKRHSVTHLNRFGKPDEVQTLDDQGGPAATHSYRYDGFGRSIEQTLTFSEPATGKGVSAEHKRTTKFTYDIWGRMTRTDRPDGTALSRKFAKHTTGELATQLLLHTSKSDKGTSVCDREFDGIDRLTSMHAGPRSETLHYQGSLMLPQKRTLGSGRTLSYEYNPAVTTSPTKIVAGQNNKTSTFKYDNSLANITTAKNDQGERTYHYTDQGHLLSESWKDGSPGSKSQERTYRTSLQGRMLDNRDDEIVSKTFEYDALGRTSKIKQGKLEATFTYNTAGLLETTLTTDTDSKQALLCTQVYDHWGRETSRTLQLQRNGAPIDERTLKQVWRGDSALHSRTLLKGATPLLTETFKYDDRDRLYEHLCEGSALPTNSKGRKILNQAFEFDSFDNMLLCITEFEDGNVDEAFYSYFEDSPFQLESVSHSLTSDYRKNQHFTYDSDGNMKNDEQGNTLLYDEDSANLIAVIAPDGATLASYRYDGHGQLLGVTQGTDKETLRRYEGYRVGSTLQDGLLTQYLYDGATPLGMQQSGQQGQTRLFMANNSNSVIAECAADGTVHEAGYSAYGEVEEGKLLGLLGFNAEAREQGLGWYLLGRGYRAYNPSLMRFHSPDNSAPEQAGINPYVYCLGNPVMWQDPTGHYAEDWGPNRDPVKQKEKRGVVYWLGWASAAANVALSVTFAIITGGVATPLVMAVVATGIAAAVAGLGTTLAAEFTKDPEKREKLQIAGLALSLAGNLLLAAGAYMGQRHKAAQARKAQQEASVTNADTGLPRSTTSGSAVKETAQQGTQTDIPEVATTNPRNSITNTRRASEPSVDYSDENASASSRRSSSSSADSTLVEVSNHDAAPPPPPEGIEHISFGRLIEVRAVNANALGVFTPQDIGGTRYQEVLRKNFKFDNQ